MTLAERHKADHRASSELTRPSSLQLGLLRAHQASSATAGPPKTSPDFLRYSWASSELTNPLPLQPGLHKKLMSFLLPTFKIRHPVSLTPYQSPGSRLEGGASFGSVACQAPAAPHQPLGRVPKTNSPWLNMSHTGTADAAWPSSGPPSACPHSGMPNPPGVGRLDVWLAISMPTHTHLACIISTVCLCHSAFGDNLATASVFNTWPRSPSCHQVLRNGPSTLAQGLHQAPIAHLAQRHRDCHATFTSLDRHTQVPHAVTGVQSTCSYLAQPHLRTTPVIHCTLHLGVSTSLMGQRGHCLRHVYTTLNRRERMTLAEQRKAAYCASSELTRPPPLQLGLLKAHQASSTKFGSLQSSPGLFRCSWASS
ncbi:hypothetical protein E2C01_057762 [Portunus trituberculatus]|uniref:Uncharacterized protein n=1 Tax=Portunus trituberculatus TaxID=210409 RepID=A0A5B7GUE9_PORTR|nr:hypothetical protein [Portunus trituberculatus]